MTRRQSASKQLREDKKRIYKRAKNPAIKRRKKEDKLRTAQETINKFYKTDKSTPNRGSAGRKYWKELGEANKAYEEILIEKLGGGSKGKKELNRRLKELEERRKRERGNLN